MNERQRDAAVERTLLEDEVTVQGFDDSLLLPPGSVLTGSREMYKVFTPFSKAFVKRLQEGLPECLPAPACRAEGAVNPHRLKAFDYPREDINSALFPPERRPPSPGCANSARPR